MKTLIKFGFLSLMLSMIAFGSCRTKAKATVTSTTTPAPACKVIVDFASSGSGINNAQYDKLTQLLNSKKVKYTEKSKGREGEKEVCIPLTELNGQEKTDFIEQLKKFEDKATYVSVSVN